MITLANVEIIKFHKVISGMLYSTKKMKRLRIKEDDKKDENREILEKMKKRKISYLIFFLRKLNSLKLGIIC